MNKLCNKIKYVK